MADKNIQMTQRNTANTGWDNLYPSTKIENVSGLTDKIIVEQGTYNSGNGSYTKYGNGDVEFFGKIEFSGTFTTGSAPSFTETLPFTLVTHPIVVGTASCYDGAGAFNAFGASVHLNGTNLNNFFGHVRLDYTAATLNYIGMHYHAKAKWK